MKYAMMVEPEVLPTKLEVKFANEKPVFEAIYHSVKTALEENTTRPEIQLGTSRNDSFSRMSSEQYRNIASMRPVSEAFAPIQNSPKEDKVEQIKYTDIPNIQNEERVVSQTILPKSQENSETVIPKEAYEMEEKYSNMPREEFLKLSPDEVLVAAINHYQYFQEESGGDIDNPEVTKSDQGSSELPNVEKRVPSAEAPAIPVYRIVGEVFNSYLIVEREDKMLIIDKHAAHERIIFERNKEMMKAKEPSSQILISPVEVVLTSAEIAIVNDYLEDFEKLGFKISPKKYSILVYSIPTELSSCDVQDTISTMANRIKNGQGNAKLTRDILFEKALYQASCKAAIKAGREYVEAHTEWIIEQLMKIPDITFCPHGRPVAMELSKKNLDYQFERS